MTFVLNFPSPKCLNLDAQWSGVICRWMESTGSSFCQLSTFFWKASFFPMQRRCPAMNWWSIPFFRQSSQCFQASAAWRCSDSSRIHSPQGPCPSRRSVMLRAEAKKKIRRARFGGNWPLGRDGTGGWIYLTQENPRKMGVDLWQAFASTRFIIEKNTAPFCFG